jgi:hypothetical protein
MAAEIITLIDKQDNNEIIRDQIAAILAIEIANQRALAVTAGKTDPDEWFFDVTAESTKPLESFSNPDGIESGEISKGLVNVFFESDDFANPGSNVVQEQKVKGNFILDCYSHKNTTVDQNDDDSIIDNGDELASREADRIARFVRNILMSAQYTYLKLGRENANIVQKRYIQRRQKFAPEQQNPNLNNVVGCRLMLSVDYVEFSPQNVLDTLDTLITQCTRSSDGKILFEYQAT